MLYRVFLGIIFAFSKFSLSIVNKLLSMFYSAATAFISYSYIFISFSRTGIRIS